MKNIDKIINYMRRIIAYSILAGLVLVGIYAGYSILSVTKETNKLNILETADADSLQPYREVTRGSVDSARFAEYLNQVKPAPEQPIEAPTKWLEILGMIVPLYIAWTAISLKSFKRDVHAKFDALLEQMKSVADQKSRDNVDQRLVKIEQDAAGFVDDDNVKILIEGMGVRTRSFVRDVMDTEFTQESLDNAKLKMAARNQDGKHQVKDLGFDEHFQTQIQEIRERETRQLMTDLTRLVEDRIHNSKYERFGDIVCRFEKNFMKAVIKLHHENKA